MEKQNISFLLFEDFETLDVFGPAEIFGRMPAVYQLNYYSLAGGWVGNKDQVHIATQKLALAIDNTTIFLIPGGMGTRVLVHDTEFLDWIRRISEQSFYVLTVCTGSALLAKTGLLDGKEATTNKRAFVWVTTNGEKVLWKKNDRWTVDGKFYSSAGVSAGIDMTLGFIADQHGEELAQQIAQEIEYKWNANKEDDSFQVSE